MYTRTKCSGSGSRTQPFRQCRHRVNTWVVRARAGGAEKPFNEGAAQVRRLISRDRKEFLGNEEDILDKYKDEFGGSGERLSSNGEAGTSALKNTSASGTAAAPSAPGSLPASPFSSSPAKSPFATSSPASPFGAPAPTRKNLPVEPRGMSPTMAPDPIMKETPINLLQSINLTQIVLFFSFSTIIALMIGTFSVVVNVGAVKLAGIE